MPESIDHESGEENKSIFVLPNIESERGEVARVAETFAPEGVESFVRKFFARAGKSELVELDDEMWKNLENTDSWDITPGNWEAVRHHAEEGHPDNPRRWDLIRDTLVANKQIDAPIIVKVGDTIHLVSGNTRLMASRAAGIRPQILLVDMND